MKTGCERIFWRKEADCSSYLNRVGLQKPLYLLRVKKRYTKEGKIRRIVKAVRQIKTLFATKELPDFVSMATSVPIYGKETFQVKDQDSMRYLKNLLHQHIAGTLPNAVPFETRPHCYLKDYSLIPPKSDLFRNKVKLKIPSTFISHCILFEDQVPAINIRAIPKHKENSALFALLKDYLDKRPCWLKNVLLYTLKQDNHSFNLNEIKNNLKYMSYSYKNGPWKNAFCAYGFNPLTSEKSVMFQTIGIKLREKEIQTQDEAQFYDPSFREPCSKCFGHYQLCDVGVEAVQNILRGKLITRNGVCSKEFGWLTANEHAKILKAMKDSTH